MEHSQQEYIAFISYRHKPLDMAIAEELIKLIEHYRVPKELRKEGKTSLGKVFRDRDEMGMCHDLEDVIYPSLDHSDFLIVVCTPDTSESDWVSLEINRFLQTHSRERILVIHAAGTAEAAIPEAITHVYDKNGTLVEINKPLSIFLVDSNEKKILSNLRKEFLRIAAFLMSQQYDSFLRKWEYANPRKRLKQEILRLISALLGCPYDELIQRNKRYLYQRLMIFSTVFAFFLLIFSAVVIQKNRQISNMNDLIQQQLYQSQWNESEALTLMSMQQLEDGNRIAAIRSALAALPNQESDRPYYPQAANALAEALNPFAPGTAISTHSTLDISGEVTDMIISDDGNYAAILNEHDILQFYNIQTGKEIWSMHHNENPTTPDEEMNTYHQSVNDAITLLFLAFSNDGDKIIHATPEATCVLSSATGEHIHTIEYPRSLTAAVSGDEETLAVYTEGSFRFYNLKTGAEQARTEKLPFEDTSYQVLTSACFSKDNSTLLTVGLDLSSQYDYENSTMHFALVDPTTGCTLRHFTQDQQNNLSFCVLTPLSDNGFLIFFGSTGKSTSCLMRITSSGEILYNHLFETDLDDSWYNAFWTGVNNDYFICEATDQTYFFDLETGSNVYRQDQTIAGRANAVAGIIDHNHIIRICYEGIIQQYEIVSEADDIYLRHISELNIGVRIRDVAFSGNQTSVFCILPTNYTGEESIARFIAYTANESTETFACNGSSSVYMSPSGKNLLYGSQRGLITDSDSIVHESPFDAKTGIPFPGDYGYIDFCGFNAEEDKLIYNCGITQCLETGKIREIDLWYDLPTLNENWGSLVTNSGEDIKYNEVSFGLTRFLYRSPGEPLLSAVYHDGKIHWWLDDQHFESSPCPYTDFVATFDKTASVTVGENRLIMIRVAEEQLWSIDHFAGGASTSAYVIYSIEDDIWYYLEFPFVPNAHYAYIPSSTEKWIACIDDSRNLYLYNVSQGTVQRQIQIPFDASAIEILHFLPGDSVMLAFLDSGFCYVIDTTTGESLCERINIGPSYDKTIQIDIENQRLFVYGMYATDGVIIDMNNWSVLCHINGLRGYLPTSNKLLLHDSANDRLAFFPAYSVEEMIEIARNKVG